MSVITYTGSAPAPKHLKTYVSPEGKDVFQEWFTHLKDRKGRSIIRARLDRLETGNPGDCAGVGAGVHELRIHWGPGYRIYFGEEGKTAVILLIGGDKSTQRKDIHKAQAFWAEYRNRTL